MNREPAGAHRVSALWASGREVLSNCGKVVVALADLLTVSLTVTPSGVCISLLGKPQKWRRGPELAAKRAISGLKWLIFEANQA